MGRAAVPSPHLPSETFPPSLPVPSFHAPLDVRFAPDGSPVLVPCPSRLVPSSKGAGFQLPPVVVARPSRHVEALFFSFHFQLRRMRRTTRMLRRLLHLRAREGRNRRNRVEEQDLRDVRVREVYRTRSKDEVELAEWEGNEETQGERVPNRSRNEEENGVETPETPTQVAMVGHTGLEKRELKPVCVRYLLTEASADEGSCSVAHGRMEKGCLPHAPAKTPSQEGGIRKDTSCEAAAHAGSSHKWSHA
eukprot:scaffold64_cov338-Pavlova_lutheri.AAC.70